MPPSCRPDSSGSTDGAFLRWQTSHEEPQEANKAQQEPVSGSDRADQEEQSEADWISGLGGAVIEA